MQCVKHPQQRLKEIHKADGHTYRYCPRCRRNARRRAENAALRELCGTSARAARIDMGL